jgi:hypothetical protein
MLRACGIFYENDFEEEFTLAVEFSSYQTICSLPTVSEVLLNNPRILSDSFGFPKLI